MVKLVEEVVISSDVLVDVLVQVGFLDKAFVDGNVSRIDSSYGRDRVNTYSITVEKEVSLNSAKGECDSCTHTYEEKKVDNRNLLSEQLMKAKEVSNKIDEGRKEEDSPNFISPLEFTLNLIASLNEQASKDEEIAKYAEKLKGFKF